MDSLTALHPAFTTPSFSVCGEFTPRATAGSSDGLEVMVNDLSLCAPEPMAFDRGEICLITPLPCQNINQGDSETRSLGRFQHSRTLSLVHDELDRKVSGNERSAIFNMLADPALCQLITPQTHYLAQERAFEAADKLDAFFVYVVSYAFQDADKKRYTFFSVDPARCDQNRQRVYVARQAITGFSALTKQQAREESALICEMAHLPRRTDLNIRSMIHFEHGHALVREPVGIIASRLRYKVVEAARTSSRTAKHQI